MQTSQRWIVGLLVVIALLLGVVIALIVRPGDDASMAANEVVAGAANMADDAEGPSTQEAAEGDPIDAAVDNVLADSSTQPTEVKVAAIPRTFWGVWTRNVAQCGQPDGDDSAFEISARKLQYWESSGDVKSVTLAGPSQIEVAASFSGEGETWDDKVRYSLSPARDALRVSGTNGQSWLYHRCP